MEIELEDILEMGRQVGLDDVGVAEATCLTEQMPFMEQWLQEGRNGSMDYMQRNQDKRLDPRLLVPGTRTIVSVVISYYKEDKQPSGAPYIAMSGLSERDYHEVLKEKLKALEDLLVAKYTDEIVDSELQHIFCDSAPVLERAWAVRARLGVIGKNRQFLHPRFGSYVHLGELFLKWEVKRPSKYPLKGDFIEHGGHVFNPCEGCDKCLRACPTKAITEAGIDARRCVSYLTIERKEELPAEHAGKPYMTLYGCDNCQKVCPVNQALVPNLHPELAANPELLKKTKEDWEQTSRKQKTRLLRRLAK